MPSNAAARMDGFENDHAQDGEYQFQIGDFDENGNYLAEDNRWYYQADDEEWYAYDDENHD